LSEGDAADRLDFGEPQRAVRTGPRKHDADRAVLLLRGQGAEQVIHRQMEAARIGSRRHLQAARRSADAAADYRERDLCLGPLARLGTGGDCLVRERRKTCIVIRCHRCP
jgi:hypothetical protein